MQFPSASVIVRLDVVRCYIWYTTYTSRLSTFLLSAPWNAVCREKWIECEVRAPIPHKNNELPGLIGLIDYRQNIPGHDTSFLH